MNQNLLSNLYFHQYLFTFKAKDTFSMPQYYIPLLRDELKHQIFRHFKFVKQPQHKDIFTIMRQPEAILTNENIYTTLSAEHPLYTVLKGKTTPGWWLQYAGANNNTYQTDKDILQVRLVICGFLNKIWENNIWFDVLNNWADQGLGIPHATFKLESITEQHPHFQDAEIYSYRKAKTALPQMPVTFSDVAMQHPIYEASIRLISPTLIDKYNLSYSFTTVTEKILSRALRLQLLYCAGQQLWLEDKTERDYALFNIKNKEALVIGSHEVRLKDIQLQYRSLVHKSPQQKESKPIEGYTGYITYMDKHADIITAYTPLLLLAEYISIGEHIQYGNGWVKCIY